MHYHEMYLSCENTHREITHTLMVGMHLCSCRGYFESEMTALVSLTKQQNISKLEEQDEHMKTHQDMRNKHVSQDTDAGVRELRRGGLMM